MNKKLGFCALFGMMLFLILMGPPDGILKNKELSESFVGMVLISITVLSILVPWIYVIEKTRSEKNTKWFWLCFLFWPITPYYLLRVRK